MKNTKLENVIRSRLKEFRVRHGITQEEFAKRAKLNYKYYQSVEAGRRGAAMRITTLEKIVKPYGIKPHQLIGPSIPRTVLK